MTISPSSDLILDVMRNADPIRARAAIAGLDSNAAALSHPFTQDVSNKVSRSESGKSNFNIMASTTTTRNLAARSAVGSINAENAGRKLEGLLLKQAFEQMLPDNIVGAGKKKAGADVWRSLLAEKLADSVSKQISLGVADLITTQLNIRKG